jgi:hypothetical protein
MDFYCCPTEGIRKATATRQGKRIDVRLTLMLHTYIEEKRARARQMWLRTVSDRSRRT